MSDEFDNLDLLLEKIAATATSSHDLYCAKFGIVDYLVALDADIKAEVLRRNDLAKLKRLYANSEEANLDSS